MIQSVSKYTFRQSPMLLGLERLLSAQPLSDHVRPTKCQRQQCNQLLQARRLDHVRFFKSEAATLQATEQGFDFPSLGIGFYRGGGVMRRYHDEIFATG